MLYGSWRDGFQGWGNNEAWCWAQKQIWDVHCSKLFLNRDTTNLAGVDGRLGGHPNKMGADGDVITADEVSTTNWSDTGDGKNPNDGPVESGNI